VDSNGRYRFINSQTTTFRRRLQCRDETRSNAVAWQRASASLKYLRVEPRSWPAGRRLDFPLEPSVHGVREGCHEMEWKIHSKEIEGGRKGPNCWSDGVQPWGHDRRLPLTASFWRWHWPGICRNENTAVLSPWGPAQAGGPNQCPSMWQAARGAAAGLQLSAGNASGQALARPPAHRDRSAVWLPLPGQDLSQPHRHRPRDYRYALQWSHLSDCEMPKVRQTAEIKAE
jgi:hypothetical protein